MSGEPVQLLVYRFGSGAAFQGQLAGALERMEAGGALRVLDVVAVGIDRATGKTYALSLRGGRAGGLTAALLDFRFDAGGGRAAATRKAAAGDHGALIDELAAELQPGEALVALLVGHAWAGELDRAVTGNDGRELINTPVEPASLLALRGELVAAAQRGD